MSVRKSYFASVSVKADRSLSSVAEALNAVLDGFLLREDASGRFEEYLAFTDEKEGVELQLVGNSQEEGSQTDYSLTLRCLNVEPLEVGTRIGSTILSALPTQLLAEKNGYVNVSKYLSERVMSETDLGCYPAWIT